MLKTGRLRRRRKGLPQANLFNFEQKVVMTRSTATPFALVVLLGLAPMLLSIASAQSHGGLGCPNIVVILADDMGYGDAGCYNLESKIPTPNIDRLASQGVRFTDAHSPGAWCVPTRYGLLTGHMPYRTTLHVGRQPDIDPGRMTLASLLKQHGYAATCVGKWHLGFDGGVKNHDFAEPLTGGPVDRGFDHYFGIHASLDIPPYFYIRNRDAFPAPTEQIDASNTEGWSDIQGAFWRAGGMAPNFRHANVLPDFFKESIQLIQQYARQSLRQPLFLYLALPAPHTPWLPSERFRGKSGAGIYGDFVMQVDDGVGLVLNALRESDMADNTLVIFTSDNGPVWYQADVTRFGHHSVGPLRGIKGDSWEGGHRIPFIAHWPRRIPANTVSDQIICQTDLLATFAAILDYSLPDDFGEDSFSLLPVLLNPDLKTPIHKTIVLKNRATVIRQGPWKLITHLGSGGLSEPRKVKPTAGGPTGQLYNLENDLAETTNLWSAEPEIVARLQKLLEQIKERGHTRSLAAD